MAHIERQVQGSFTGWLKHTLAPPFLEHLSFRLGNQLFFVRIEIDNADVAVPGSRDGLHNIANGCNGHACIMPMRFRNETWCAEAGGWGLLDARTGKLIDPPALVTDKPIEMTDWELHDFCVQFVRDHLRRLGKTVTSWQGNPAVDPSIWTAGTDAPEWVVVRAVRYRSPKALRPNNWDRIAKACARLGTTGYFASVAVANADGAFAPDEVPVTPLWRGYGLRVGFAGLELPHN